MINILRRFIPPYRSYVVLNVFFNILATVLSLFSFATIIPVLRLLFGLTELNAHYTELTATMPLKDYLEAARANLYWYMGTLVEQYGAGYVLLILGAFLVVTTGLKCLCAWLANFFIIPVRTGVLRDLRRQLYEKITSLPLGYFSEEHKGDIMSRMTNDVNEVESSIMSSVDILFKNPLTILIYVIMLFVISWQLSVFALVLLPIAGFIIGRIGRSLKRSSKQGQEQTADILTQIEETLSGLRVVKAFNAESKLQARFLKLINETRATFIRINRRYYLAHPVSEFLGTALIAVLLWYGGGLILGGHALIDASTFIYYLILFYSIINPAKDLSRASYGIRRGTAALERIDKILDTQSNIREAAEPVTPSFRKSVVYEHVSFAYNAQTDVLKDINLEIEKGAMVALVGQSGSGKTTLADLLPRFYDVTHGSISIDGTDIRQCRISALRELIGYVNQDAILFNDTFYNNITFGVDTSRPREDGQTWQQAVEQAARIANAHEFIMATPEGYQTGVGDRGSKLSGGQRQRISIARAILKNPPILILDEATSALDTESEMLVQDALEHLMKDRTTLVIAHRLSTIRNADMICVIQDGQIVERGKHDELLAQHGQYAKLIALQNNA